jgi:4-hydroxy-2-oxoheptanedioate aldolase
MRTSVLRNKTKEKMLRGEVVLGCGIGYPDPEMVEAIGQAGFDFVRFEGEHGPNTYMDLEHMVRAAQLFDVTPTARVPGNVEHEILHYLDRGIMGVTVPRVSSRAEAEAAVRAAKHYPLGQRGDFYPGRSFRYGDGLSQEEYYERANATTLLIALIETRGGLDTIEEIVATPGIDAIEVGPWDLRQSMGLPDQTVVYRAVDRIVEVATRAGLPVGVGTAFTTDNPANLRAFMEKGVRYFLTSSDTCFAIGAERAFDVLRAVQLEVGLGD